MKSPLHRMLQEAIDAKPIPPMVQKMVADTENYVLNHVLDQNRPDILYGQFAIYTVLLLNVLRKLES